MSKALIAGINQVATDKGLDREVIFSAIEVALVSAYKRNYGSVANVSAEVDRVSGDMRVFAEREVVDDVFNPRTEITEKDARVFQPTVQLGDVIRVPTTPADFGRIAAQTAKQVILQRIREAERDTVFENFAHHIGEIITAQVRSIDALSGAVTLMMDEKHEVLMMREDQIHTEKLRRGDFVKVYVVDVHKSSRGPVIKISRTHRNLLKRLMEQEIPEVRDGTVEIKSIAREPGARSKLAVIATKPDVDPVGSCVGQRGLRIQNIVNELAGEKIDVVQWNGDPVVYISNALSPAKVNTVLLDENSAIKTAMVIVPDRQLSLAIGKEGQNARLAAKLTGWRIDIKSETEASAEGLDQVLMERAQRAISRGDDLLSRAERILRDDGGNAADDRLRQAAAALDRMPQLPSEGFSIPDLTDLPSFDSLTDKDKSKWDLAMAGLGEVEEKSTDDGLPGSWELETITPEFSEQPFVEPSKPSKPAPKVQEPVDSGLTTITDLPQVITADMLRARRAQRKETQAALPAVEVPAELLAGLEPVVTPLEDWDAELESERPGGKGKGKGKDKSKKAVLPIRVDKSVKSDKKSKKPKWRPGQQEDVDDFY